MTILQKNDDVTTSKGNKITLKRKNSEPARNSSTVKRPLTDDMLNGYKNATQHEEADLLAENNGDALKESPVATLSNMGYTCYLNSVLYALRFTPAFLHNLHHLIGDLAMIYARLSQTKAKTSSLGRNVGGLSSGPGARSTSSKDLLSLNGAALDTSAYKSKVQIVTEKLHELFVTMHNLEVKESTEPFQPSGLLQAIRDANSIFEGNHQQDAHELFLYLLDNLRETCDLLAQQVTQNPQLLSESFEQPVRISPPPNSSNSKIWSYRHSWKWSKSKKEKNHTKEPINEEIINTATLEETPPVNANETDTTPDPVKANNTKKHCYNFVEDFEGVTLCRTKCLECESVTERKESFYDIPVPVKENSFEGNSIEQHFLNVPQTNASDLFRLACVTTEKLSDSNKYLCETCNRYNEAIREVVFEKLPNVMVFQLKRFTTATGGAPQKLKTFMPTPLQLKCFCEQCCRQNEANAGHHYELCCVIMHLGDTMYSGHYIAYVRAQNATDEYFVCQRDHVMKNATLSASSSEKSLNILKFFNKPRALSSNSFMERNGLSHSGGSSKSSSQMNGLKMCSGVNCCGVRCNKTIMENVVNGTTKENYMQQQNDCVWFECDDENIRAITSHELEQELSFKTNSTSTPYLLFYTKVND